MRLFLVLGFRCLSIIGELVVCGFRLYVYIEGYFLFVYVLVRGEEIETIFSIVNIGNLI